MVIRPPNEDKLNERFNQLVGNRTGRPRQASRATSNKAIQQRKERRQAGAGKKAISTAVRHGGLKVSASVKKQHESWFGTGGSAFASPTAGMNKTFNDVYENLTAQLNQQVRDQISTRVAYAESQGKQVDPSTGMPIPPVGGEDNAQYYDPKTGKPASPDDPLAMKLGPSLDEQYLGGNLQKFVVEPLTRPLSAIAGATYGWAENYYDARDADKHNVAELLKDMVSGAIGGATSAIRGKEHHGMGDVYELMKNRDESIGGSALRSLEEHAPWAEQTIARAAGLADIPLDPVGKIFGGAKAGVIAGERATPETVRAYTRSLAERWAADAETQIITGSAKAPGGYRYHPSEAAIADHMEKSINDIIDTAELQVSSGGSRHRYQILNPKMTAGLAGAHGAESLQKSLTGLFTDRVQRLVDGIHGKLPGGTKLSGNALDHWAALNPDFTEFLDDLTIELVNDNKLPVNASRDMLANYLSTGDTKLIRNIEQDLIDRKYSPYLQDASNTIAREFRNAYYNAPALRIGKKIFPAKAVGRAFSALESKYFEGIGKNFLYNSAFPGTSALDATRHRAWGIRETELFEQQLRERSSQFSKADAEEIQRIREGSVASRPELQAEADWINDQYKQMFQDEFTYGARGRKRGSKPGVDSSTTPYDPNYSYVYNTGGEKGARSRFKVDRKREIHKNVRAGNGEGAGRFKTANAKAEGLRPVENAYEALRQRRIKHNRDMIRARFLADMVDKYGITTKLSPEGQRYAAHARDLEIVPFEKLPESVRVNLEHTGENAYLPKEMKRMVDLFDDITSWNSAQHGRIVRAFSRVMRTIKKAMTLPWPGFHTKNMIGDVFMGLLDDINPDDYARVLQKGIESAAGKDGMFQILKQNPGLDLTFREMWGKYQTEANSGFINAELADLHAPAKYNLPQKVLGAAGRGFQTAAGFREDIGRFTHYSTAYQQEARALWEQGYRDLQRIDKMASSAALWRVNNYRFDYNALLLWEKQAKTLFFPFYTFIRKAAPTLVQALYQDPRWINQWTRFLYQRSTPDGQESASSFDGFRVPQDIRDVGYGFLGGEQDSPWYVTNDILPTSTFNAVRTKNPHEFFNSVLTQLALPYQVGIEQGTNRQAYLDKPLQDQGFADYLFSKIPGTREFGQFFDKDKSWGEKLISSRIGAGLPIRHLDESQQLYAEQEWQDRLVDEPLKQLNYSQDLFYISSRYPSPEESNTSSNLNTGGAKVYVVNNRQVLDEDNNPVEEAVFYTPQEAIDYVKSRLPADYQKIQATWDIDSQGRPYRRAID